MPHFRPETYATTTPITIIKNHMISQSLPFLCHLRCYCYDIAIYNNTASLDTGETTGCYLLIDYMQLIDIPLVEHIIC